MELGQPFEMLKPGVGHLGSPQRKRLESSQPLEVLKGSNSPSSTARALRGKDLR